MVLYAPAALDLSFYFLALRLLLITFSDLIDCLSRSALEFDAREPRFAWPADPVPVAGVSIVLASSLAPRMVRSLFVVMLFCPACAAADDDAAAAASLPFPRFDCEAEPSFIALEFAGGRGDTTFPLSDWPPWALC